MVLSYEPRSAEGFPDGGAMAERICVLFSVDRGRELLGCRYYDDYGHVQLHDQKAKNEGSPRSRRSKSVSIVRFENHPNPRAHNGTLQGFFILD
ncbi:hypothetical protein D3C74_354890 [compost metagenome]